MPSWFVYILKSRIKDFKYVGSTNNLVRHVHEHDEGLVQSTKAYRPLELTAYVAVSTERKARELEKYFKTGSGKAILKRRILADEAPQERSRSLALRFEQHQQPIPSLPHNSVINLARDAIPSIYLGGQS